MFLAVDGNDTPWSSEALGIMFAFGFLALVTVLVVVLVRAVADYRKAKMIAGNEQQYRTLVQRYEQLAETTLDAQQRACTELVELRTRVAGVEQVLRTVE